MTFFFMRQGEYIRLIKVRINSTEFIKNLSTYMLLFRCPSISSISIWQRLGVDTAACFWWRALALKHSPWIGQRPVAVYSAYYTLASLGRRERRGLPARTILCYPGHCQSNWRPLDLEETVSYWRKQAILRMFRLGSCTCKAIEIYIP
jgi:hypothetical protein